MPALETTGILCMNPVDFILHVDQHLLEFLHQYGTGLYLILFLIVFVETGIVVMPFLPGDSLLFAAGAIAATGAMDPWLLGGLLFTAAVMGDNTNYFVGRHIGPKVFEIESRWIRREYLERTRDFFKQHGGKTVIFARFIPIIRTFAPFVAGVGHMPYRRFLAFDLAGALAWVGSFVTIGYFFGNHPLVKKNFTLVILGIIFVSFLPAAIEFVRHHLGKNNDPAK